MISGVFGEVCGWIGNSGGGGSVLGAAMGSVLWGLGGVGSWGCEVLRDRGMLRGCLGDAQRMFGVLMGCEVLGDRGMLRGCLRS